MPPSASWAIVLPTTLQIASVGWPLRFISRRAASVSAVSPLCVMANSSVLLVERRIAVAQLAGVFDFDRNAGQLFDQVLADQGRVPTGAAGGEHECGSTRRSCCGVRFSPPNTAVASSRLEPAAHGVAKRLGLLEDLLEHVVRIAVELDVVGLDVEHAARCARRGPDRDGSTRSESAVTTAIS